MILHHAVPVPADTAHARKYHLSSALLENVDLVLTVFYLSAFVYPVPLI